MIIKEIKNGKYRGQLYATNTLKQTFQMLVIIIDRFLINNTNFNKNQLKTIKDKINLEFDRYKELSSIETEEKVYNGIVPSFKTYLQQVKEMFCQESKHYLVALLYSIFTMRDNFKALKIIENETENDGVNNFLLFNKKQFKIIINDFKTKKKYKIVTTSKLHDIHCTLDDNYTIKTIAAISTQAKIIIAINTGPIVGIFNEFTLNNTKKIYFIDKYNTYHNDKCKRINFFSQVNIEELL
jgi:sensor c-di-GMP phosphodiesterase-like protein